MFLLTEDDGGKPASLKAGGWIEYGFRTVQFSKVFAMRPSLDS